MPDNNGSYRLVKRGKLDECLPFRRPATFTVLGPNSDEAAS